MESIGASEGYEKRHRARGDMTIGEDTGRRVMAAGLWRWEAFLDRSRQSSLGLLQHGTW